MRRVLDTDGQPVSLVYYNIIDMPGVTVPESCAMGGEDVPLFGFNGDGSWTTSIGRVRARDVWDVLPMQKQTPFLLDTPWKAKVMIGDSPDLLEAKVFGWDGTAWLTDRGQARHVQDPTMIDRTIDDDWLA